MNSASYSFRTILEKHSPEQVELRAGLLIRLYLKNKNQYIAKAIVEHINAILSFPRFITDMKQRCALRRLAAHWSCLAWADDIQIPS